MVPKGPKKPKKGKKGLRKVQKYHKTDRIGPKFVKCSFRKMPENEPYQCKITLCVTEFRLCNNLAKSEKYLLNLYFFKGERIA